ncbi:VCBS repeat-containing protein [Streptomyces sp. RS10V-4]|uniref:FG-GAP repeat domain-containing protein n=1 Tax=Streptomyces rhizoryzae TaxID=2932493 RepID=UPI00200500DF|nr:VCBS repeat-containing protein [Streptomyces rhizoryzae]MCK7626431.1 VCBS repeat-containing protein [Streptomyces rhizoryzae]
MAILSGRTRGRVLSRLATAAIAVALAGTAAGTSYAADSPGAAARNAVQAAPKAPAKAPKAITGATTGAAGTDAANPVFPLFGVDSSGGTYYYGPDGNGGLTAREKLDDLGAVRANQQAVDSNGDGYSDGVWLWDPNGNLVYSADDSTDVTQVGGGWNIYDKVLAPGNLGGAQQYDILARDRSGVLWLYLGYPDGTVTTRTKVGAGWQIYDQIAGKGDLTGDGKADIIAREKSTGDLYLYKGTGDRTAPFAARQKIGTGWGGYNALLSTGDLDLDGKTDFIARDTSGRLFAYYGTGNAASPYKARVQIGTGWNIYTKLFS